MRFAEIALLGFPFVVFAAWRFLAPHAGAPRNLVIAVIGTFVVMTVILLVLWREQEAAPDAGYVPARLENGRIVPGRVVPGSAAEPPPAAK